MNDRYRRSLSIKQKVLSKKNFTLILILTIVFTTIVVLASYLSLKRVINKKDEAVFNYSEMMIDVEKLNTLVEEKISDSRGHLLTGNPELYDNIFRARDDFYQILGRIKTQVKTQIGITYLSKVTKIENEHQIALLKLMEIKNNQASLSVISEAFNKTLRPLCRRLKDSIEDFTDYQQKLFQQERFETTVEAKRAEIILVLMGACLIFFISLVFLIIFRSYSLIISTEKEMDLLRRESDKNLQKFLDLVNHLDHSVVWEAIPQPFQIEFMSDRSQLLFGLTSKEFIKNSELFFKYVHENDLPIVKNIFRNAERDMRDHRCDHRMFDADGGYRWVQTGVQCKMDNEGKKKLFGITVDITPLKKAELELASALKGVNEYKLALDASSIVAITDVRGTITYVNEKFCEISKYSKEELIGQNHRILNSGHHSKEFFRDLYKTITQGKIWRGEIRNKAKDGTLYWVDTFIIPFIDNNKPIQYMAIRNDITKRKNYEQEKQQLIEDLEAERDARLKFVSMLTHDLRTPLTAALLSTQAIKRQSEDQDHIFQLSSRVIHNIMRTDEMIQDLLDADRVRAGQVLLVKFKRFELIDLIKKILLDMEQTYGNRFQLQGLNEIFVTWDPKGIRRMLENLLNNALKYGKPEKKIIIAINKNNDDVDIEVSNEGEDISENDLNKLFSHFSRTSSAESSGIKGWGIGLTLVKGIAEAHQGKVKVTSQSGRTTFIVTLNPNIVQS